MAISKIGRTFDARPDTPDFRDKLYEATLVEVPPRVPLASYLRSKVPVLDQGQEGACTGFGLAAVANYLLRRRRVSPDTAAVSPRMFYEMARRYDEWPGEAYDGSSARGAMKGWHKHGVCAEADWPYDVNDPGQLTDDRAGRAARRPLGAYYRVNHKDLVCMHSALAEVGILYATAAVHTGWQAPAADGVIEQREEILGGHAFAIVAYDDRGLWVQNSWGDDWGRGGFGLMTYDDWLANGSDVWVARLGVPVALRTARGAAATRTVVAGGFEGYAFRDLRPHVISLGNDGRFRDTGTYGTDQQDATEILTRDLPQATAGWSAKRILLYAHGGLVDEGLAVQRVAQYRAALLRHEVYPLSFVWKTDAWTTLRNVLADAARRRRPEGVLDRVQEFIEDRFDDVLEPLARTLGGKMLWDEMKENAVYATERGDGGARFVADRLVELAGRGYELHVAGHSAGSIFHAPLVRYLAGKGVPIRTCTLWAPACTIGLFREFYLPLIRSGRIERFALFTLTDRAERDDTCAGIYRKSLLYLVSHAFERAARVPLIRPGEPLLGMSEHVRAAADVGGLFGDDAGNGGAGRCAWVRAPNTVAIGDADASRATSHGGFDDDEATLKATLARILNADKVVDPVSMTDRLMPVELGIPAAGVDLPAPARPTRKRPRSNRRRRKERSTSGPTGRR